MACLPLQSDAATDQPNQHCNFAIMHMYMWVYKIVESYSLIPKQNVIYGQTNELD